MNSVRGLHSAWLFAAAIALALSACEKSDHQVKASPQAQSGPPPASTSSAAAPPSQMAQADTKSDTNAGETAKGNDEPMKSMDKDEEQKSMPQPGQANDHSTVAQDPKQK